MKQKNIVIFLFSTIVTLSVSASTSVTDKYTMEQIYNNMCIECHGPSGLGNTEKLTPSMKNLSQQEIEDSLLDVEDDNDHVIMEHNRGEILKKGMQYSAKDMASYMFKRFNK